MWFHKNVCFSWHYISSCDRIYTFLLLFWYMLLVSINWGSILLLSHLTGAPDIVTLLLVVSIFIHVLIYSLFHILCCYSSLNIWLWVCFTCKEATPMILGPSPLGPHCLRQMTCDDSYLINNQVLSHWQWLAISQMCPLIEVISPTDYKVHTFLWHIHPLWGDRLVTLGYATSLDKTITSIETETVSYTYTIHKYYLKL